MPAYSSTTPNTAVYAGDPPFYLFNAEVVAAGQASQRFASTSADNGATVGYTFAINWAAAPTATVVIQSADVDADANYVDTEFTSTIQNDQITVTNRHRFYRAKVMAFTAGGALTVYVVK